MKLNQKKINALYDSDLEFFLKKINIYEDILKWKKKCKFTNEVITFDNIYSIYKAGWDIKIVSDAPQAIKEFLKYLHKNI